MKKLIIAVAFILLAGVAFGQQWIYQVESI